jgi:malic enzyme
LKIESPKVFDIIKRLQNELSVPVFHDDQHGTAVITGSIDKLPKIIEQKK